MYGLTFVALFHAIGGVALIGLFAWVLLSTMED